MPNSYATPIIFALIACFAASSIARASANPSTQPTVLVELFTSEGCSSCPPADSLLAKLSRQNAVAGVQMIPLAMHVDYWNYLGWTDRFSSPQFSERQQQYARLFHASEVYTPQMVVDGTEQFVGSDEQKATTAIRTAAAAIKGTVAIELTPIPHNAHSLSCTISVDGIPPSLAQSADLMLAVTEDDLSTSVARGENAGATLHHTAVVRSLRRVTNTDAQGIKRLSTSAAIDLQPDWQIEKLHVVAWVQDPQSGRILACNQVSAK